MGAVPFTGPLAILTDEGTASASEILAAGLQEAKRAIVVGDTSLGAVLPSVIEALPGGAVMQYVVADFKTPKGVAAGGARRPARQARRRDARGAARRARPGARRGAGGAEIGTSLALPRCRRPRPPLRLILVGVVGCASNPPPAATTAPASAPSATATPAAAPASAAAPARRRRRSCARPRRSWPTRWRRPAGAAAWNAHKTAHFKIETTLAGDGDGRDGRALPDPRRQVADDHRRWPASAPCAKGRTARSPGREDPLQGHPLPRRRRGGAGAHRGRRGTPTCTPASCSRSSRAATEPGPDGAPLECVIATPKLGPPLRSCYDAETHLQVSQSGVRATPQGDVPFRAIIRDWRDVGGVKIPFESDTQVGPITTARPGHVGRPSTSRWTTRCSSRPSPGPAARRRARVSRKVILCRCEDVTLADVQHAVALGLRATSRRSSATPASAPGPARARSACAAVVARDRRGGRARAGDAGAVHVAAAAGADELARAGGRRGAAPDARAVSAS